MQNQKLQVIAKYDLNETQMEYVWNDVHDVDVNTCFVTWWAAASGANTAGADLPLT